MSEEVLATNGVSTEGVEDSAMDVMTNGEAGEGKEKSIMEMIAAGDFDAGSDDPPANDTPGQQEGEDVHMEEEEVAIKEENKVAEEAVKETADEVKINGGDVEIKKEKDGEDAEGASAAANAGEEVTSGESGFKIDVKIIQFLIKTLPLLKVMMTNTQRKIPQEEYL